MTSKKSTEFKKIISEIMNPKEIYPCECVLPLKNRSLFKESNGIYAWYLKKIPIEVPTEECHKIEYDNQTFTLLYLGIAPSLWRGTPSKQTLRKRMRTHYRGNIYGSTLRKSLACLLKKDLQLSFYRSEKRNRLRLKGDGEKKLSDWMSKNAFVTWSYVDKPWLYEKKLIKCLNLPLNLQHNQGHPFYQTLSMKRKIETI